MGRTPMHSNTSSQRRNTCGYQTHLKQRLLKDCFRKCFQYTWCRLYLNVRTDPPHTIEQTNNIVDWMALGLVTDWWRILSATAAASASNNNSASTSSFDISGWFSAYSVCTKLYGRNSSYLLSQVVDLLCFSPRSFQPSHVRHRYTTKDTPRMQCKRWRRTPRQTLGDVRVLGSVSSPLLIIIIILLLRGMRWMLQMGEERCLWLLPRQRIQCMLSSSSVHIYIPFRRRCAQVYVYLSMNARCIDAFIAHGAETTDISTHSFCTHNIYGVKHIIYIYNIYIYIYIYIHTHNQGFYVRKNCWKRPNIFGNISPLAMGYVQKFYFRV